MSRAYNRRPIEEQIDVANRRKAISERRLEQLNRVNNKVLLKIGKVATRLQMLTNKLDLLHAHKFKKDQAPVEKPVETPEAVQA